jgi:hypothetical protein
MSDLAWRRRWVPSCGASSRGARERDGFTLIEFVSGSALLLVVIAGFLYLYVTEQALNEHAVNLSWAAADADRVMEQLRSQNFPGTCAGINTNPPVGADWDAWLADVSAAGGGGKNVPVTTGSQERVVLSVPAPAADPRPVVVSVCWRHRDRTIGECNWDPATQTLTENPGMSGDPNVTSSPAMLATLLTCRE